MLNIVLPCERPAISAFVHSVPPVCPDPQPLTFVPDPVYFCGRYRMQQTRRPRPVLLAASPVQGGSVCRPAVDGHRSDSFGSPPCLNSLTRRFAPGAALQGPCATESLTATARCCSPSPPSSPPFSTPNPLYARRQAFERSAH
jgi:hypothetical protein